MLFQQFGQEGFDLPAFGARDLFGTLLDGLFGNLFGFAASCCCFLDRNLFLLGGASRTLVLFVVQRRQRVQRFAIFLALADIRRASSERGIRRGHNDDDDIYGFFFVEKNESSVVVLALEQNLCESSNRKKASIRFEQRKSDFECHLSVTREVFSH